MNVTIAPPPLLYRPQSSAPQPQENNSIKHAPGWRHENASQSEANVKADREPLSSNVQSMQKESVRHLKDKDGSTTATASRVMQDLKNKAQSVGENLSGQGQQVAQKAKSVMGGQEEEISQKAKNVGENMVENVADKTRAAGEYASKVKNEAAEKVGESDVAGSVKAGAEKVKKGADQVKKDAAEKMEGGDVMGGVQAGAEKVKAGADKVKQEAESAGGNVMDSVKTGAEKVTQFVKESVDSAKKAVGMDK